VESLKGLDRLGPRLRACNEVIQHVLAFCTVPESRLNAGYSLGASGILQKVGFISAAREICPMSLHSLNVTFFSALTLSHIRPPLAVALVCIPPGQSG
jgi:hypothetical protein